MDFPLPVYLGIGLFQCLAMIPGTSRSGSTIVGALLLGADKRSAAEFSFFLAMPTMAGAVAYDLFKNRDVLSGSDFTVIAIGFIVAFISAVFRRASPARLCLAQRLRAVWLVAHHRRRRWRHRAAHLRLICYDRSGQVSDSR
jgi:undecaprenyl pyrophosphate phosphatase UppP